MIRMHFIFFIACASQLAAAPARAEYVGTNRSVNGTAETLPAEVYEVGLNSISTGVTDDIMLQVPSATLLLGSAQISLHKRFPISEGHKITPYLFAETPRYTGVGSNYGIDFGANGQHSATVGARIRYGPQPRVENDEFRADNAFSVRPNAEYDYYHRGNVAYVGVAEYTLYIGYTWAFGDFYTGLIAGPATGLIPLPYLYWRF